MGPAQGSPQELASQNRISAIQERARDQQPTNLFAPSSVSRCWSDSLEPASPAPTIPAATEKERKQDDGD